MTIKEKVLKDLEENKHIHHREKVIIKMWIEEAFAEVRKEVGDIWSNGKKGIFYHNNCSMKEVERVQKLKQRLGGEDD